MSSLTLYYTAIALLDIFPFPVSSLAVQAMVRKRQNQKERKMIKELEVARDIFKKNQVLGEEIEKVKTKLSLTQAK